MSSGRFPTIRSRECVRGLQRLGFEVVRQTGSHIRFRHPDGRAATVPSHGSVDLGRGITRSILQKAQVSLSDFLDAL